MGGGNAALTVTGDRPTAFTIHDTDKPLETVVADPGPFLRKYTIPPAAKATIRDRLQLLAIEASSLFPDFEHLAADLNAGWL